MLDLESKIAAAEAAWAKGEYRTAIRLSESVGPDKSTPPHLYAKLGLVSATSRKALAEQSLIPETALKHVDLGVMNLYSHNLAPNIIARLDRPQRFESYRANSKLAFALFHIARSEQQPKIMGLVHDNINLAQQSADLGSPADGLLKVDRAIVALRSKRQPNHHSAVQGLHQVTHDIENPLRAIDVALGLYAIGFLHNQENLYQPAEREIARLIPDKHEAFMATHKALIKGQLTDIHDNLMPLISSVWITKSEVQQVANHLVDTLPTSHY